ncbi:glycosyltransferase [Synechococcus sp. MIT S9504]|uniref:glycosyltransferase n=1 Tax=Synechococcus sp. MIT S9504 TaxID=1801628 RepID=UPI0007BBE60E|nr:glycosyltransferase [Synechococcus sp. MIT S9504]KZR84992.1 Protein Glycosylation H_1 [Synechococcus sp. MIT S9504]
MPSVRSFYSVGAIGLYFLFFMISVPITKVLVVIYCHSIKAGGGAERRFARVIQYLGSRKISTILFVPSNLFSSFRSYDLLDASQEVIKIPGRGILCILHFNASLIFRTLFLRQFDVVHNVLIQKSLLPYYIFLYLFKRLGFNRPRVINTVANYPLAYGLPSPVENRLLFSLYLQCADHIDSLYELKKTNVQCPVTITPCSFTDYSLFRPGKKENHVVFAGRMEVSKNPLLFVLAVAQVQRLCPSSILKHWRFSIYGNGSLSGEVNSLVSSLSLHNFTFSKCADLRTILPTSRVFLSLQQYENYPSQSLMEAISCHNIIIATNVGLTYKLLQPESSILVSPSLDDVYKALLDVIMGNLKISDEQLHASADCLQRFHTVETFGNYLMQLWQN